VLHAGGCLVAVYGCMYVRTDLRHAKGRRWMGSIGVVVRAWLWCGAGQVGDDDDWQLWLIKGAVVPPRCFSLHHLPRAYLVEYPS
jgi:hypothetical protein